MFRSLWTAFDNLATALNRLAATVNTVADEVQARIPGADRQAVLLEGNEVVETANGQEEEATRATARKRR
jgi:hypothetical protein